MMDTPMKSVQHHTSGLKWMFHAIYCYVGLLEGNMLEIDSSFPSVPASC